MFKSERQDQPDLSALERELQHLKLDQLPVELNEKLQQLRNDLRANASRDNLMSACQFLREVSALLEIGDPKAQAQFAKMFFTSSFSASSDANLELSKLLESNPKQTDWLPALTCCVEREPQNSVERMLSSTPQFNTQSAAFGLLKKLELGKGATAGAEPQTDSQKVQVLCDVLLSCYWKQCETYRESIESILRKIDPHATISIDLLKAGFASPQIARQSEAVMVFLGLDNNRLARAVSDMQISMPAKIYSIINEAQNLLDKDQPPEQVFRLAGTVIDIYVQSVYDTRNGVDRDIQLTSTLCNPSVAIGAAWSFLSQALNHRSGSVVNLALDEFSRFDESGALLWLKANSEFMPANLIPAMSRRAAAGDMKVSIYSARDWLRARGCLHEEMRPSAEEIRTGMQNLKSENIFEFIDQLSDASPATVGDTLRDTLNVAVIESGCCDLQRQGLKARAAFPALMTKLDLIERGQQKVAIDTKCQLQLTALAISDPQVDRVQRNLITNILSRDIEQVSKGANMYPDEVKYYFHQIIDFVSAFQLQNSREPLDEEQTPQAMSVSSQLLEQICNKLKAIYASSCLAAQEVLDERMDEI